MIKMKKIILIINIFLCSFIFADDSSVKKALVKVYAAHQMYNLPHLGKMGKITIQQQQVL